MRFIRKRFLFWEKTRKISRFSINFDFSMFNFVNWLDRKEGPWTKFLIHIHIPNMGASFDEENNWSCPIDVHSYLPGHLYSPHARTLLLHFEVVRNRWQKRTPVHTHWLDAYIGTGIVTAFLSIWTSPICPMALISALQYGLIVIWHFWTNAQFWCDPHLLQASLNITLKEFDLQNVE